MILREEAETIIARRIEPTGAVEAVPLSEAGGRVLARQVTADVDAPPFDRVTMDGYAVVAADGPGDYPVVDYVPAGSFGAIPIRPGTVARVMTGAPLPSGADAVVAVEKTGGYVDVGRIARIDATVKPGTNVAPRGEDFRAGDPVMDPPALIGPAHIAVLASVGCDPVTVAVRPTVAILATGDELVEPGVKPGPGRIRNANAYALAAQVKRAGGNPVMLGTAADDPDALAEKIARGKTCDLLLVTGGVSAGDRDFVPARLEEAGYEALIRKVRIKPGKPMLFGAATDARRYCFGLPGNPVSTFAIFELFIRPAIAALTGRGFVGLPAITAAMGYEHARKGGEREEWIPVRFVYGDNGYVAASVGYHGSAHIRAVAFADGMIKIPIGATRLSVGEKVEGRLLPPC